MCSQKKGADQVRGQRAADLRLCLPICKNYDFFTTRLKFTAEQITVLIRNFVVHKHHQTWFYTNV